MSALPKHDNIWKLSEAENKLGEVVNRTISEGRQEIHLRDDAVVVISKSELEEIENKVPRKSVKEVLLSRPEDPPGEPTLTEIILEGRKYFNDYDQ